MGSKEEIRIFVGGLSWETTDRDLEDAFNRFGKVTEAQVGAAPLSPEPNPYHLLSLWFASLLMLACNLK